MCRTLNFCIPIIFAYFGQTGPPEFSRGPLFQDTGLRQSPCCEKIQIETSFSFENTCLSFCSTTALKPNFQLAGRTLSCYGHAVERSLGIRTKRTARKKSFDRRLVKLPYTKTHGLSFARFFFFELAYGQRFNPVSSTALPKVK